MLLDVLDVARCVCCVRCVRCVCCCRCFRCGNKNRCWPSVVRSTPCTPPTTILEHWKPLIGFIWPPSVPVSLNSTTLCGSLLCVYLVRVSLLCVYYSCVCITLVASILCVYQSCAWINLLLFFADTTTHHQATATTTWLPVPSPTPNFCTTHGPPSNKPNCTNNERNSTAPSWCWKRKTLSSTTAAAGARVGATADATAKKKPDATKICAPECCSKQIGPWKVRMYPLPHLFLTPVSHTCFSSHLCLVPVLTFFAGFLFLVSLAGFLFLVFFFWFLFGLFPDSLVPRLPSS